MQRNIYQLSIIFIEKNILLFSRIIIWIYYYMNNILRSIYIFTTYPHIYIIKIHYKILIIHAKEFLLAKLTQPPSTRLSAGVQKLKKDDTTQYPPDHNTCMKCRISCALFSLKSELQIAHREGLD